MSESKDISKAVKVDATSSKLFEEVIVSTTICLNSPVYLLFGFPFDMKKAPHC